MKHAILVAALAALAAGCSGSSSAPTVVRTVSITSHGHDEHVAGVVLLAGTATAGDVVVQVDDELLPAARDGEEWSCEIDSRSWAYGWHTVQARVGEGVDSATALVNLFFMQGSSGQDPDLDRPPIAVKPTPPVFAEPPTEGLVAHWSFNDGTAKDDSGNAHHGTVYSATPASGALDFDGDGDVVYVPDRDSNPPTAISGLTKGTISIRFRYDDVDNGGTAADTLGLFYMGSNESNTSVSGADAVTIYIAHGSLSDPDLRQVYFTVLANARVTLCFDTTVTLTKGQNYTYTVSIGGPNDHKAYLNGDEVERNYNSGTTAASYAFLANVATPDILTFGYHHFGSTMTWWYHNGIIDDIVVYDRVLSSDEVDLLAGG
jgi:hypothetical protein